MRLFSSVTLIIAAMLTALLAYSGCGIKPWIESTLAEKACIELLQKVPAYYDDFEFWDVKALQEDSDLSEIYQLLQERHWLEPYGVIKVNYYAYTGWFEMVKGDINLTDARDGLVERNYYLDRSYGDIEVWMDKTGRGPYAFALIEGLFVKGLTRPHMQSGVDDFISVVRGWGTINV